MREALGILKGTGVMLPIGTAMGYFIRPQFSSEYGMIIFAWCITVACGVVAFYLGRRWNGRTLTIVGLSGYVIFAAMLALVTYYASKPIPIPPYP